MNQDLRTILDIIKQSEDLSKEEKDKVSELIKKVDNELMITSFKLDRTEKVKRTTAILLEETIEELEQKRKAVEESNAALKKSMEELRAAQAQLIHSEKMASLGELTAGIAHEIQNPLNFVNNFSDVSKELMEELKGEREKGKGDRDEELEEEILQDIHQNLDKIHHHGMRASEIVKSMLQHSRTGTGEKELTDINSLCDEYLRLAYHGMRAKDKSFNAEYKLELDPGLPKIKVVPQDIGRVLLNLINNAFQAVAGVENPKVTLMTQQLNNSITIRVVDNGPGIPEHIRDKIFQPFFTTKPTGQGTGLGLSLSYDIVKAHGGELKVETKLGEGSTFNIQLPWVL
jgi:two-component system NtrC family sensor kinase